MSTSTNNEKKVKRRKIVRRRIDSKGTITSQELSNRKLHRFNPFNFAPFKLHRLPFTILGCAIIFYSALSWFASNNQLMSYSGIFTNELNVWFTGLNDLIRTITLNVAFILVLSFFGYALITQALKINRYPRALAQFSAIIFLFLLLLSIFLPIINSIQSPSHESNEDFSQWEPNFDTSRLSSPFFGDGLGDLSDLLNGLNDTLRDDILINMSVADGFGLIPSRDQYLLRWKVDDVWNPGQNTYTTSSTSNALPFTPFTSQATFSPDDMNGLRKFSTQSALYALSSSFINEIVAPWNSQSTSLLSNTFNAFVNTEDVGGTYSNWKTLNEVPYIEMNLQQSQVYGQLQYDSYWKAENKLDIQTKSVKLSELETSLATLSTSATDRIPADLFEYNVENGIQTTGINRTWGIHSLPDNYFNPNNTQATDFVNQYNKFRSETRGENAATFEIAQLVTSFIQKEVIEAFNEGSLSLSLNSSQPEASGAIDAGHYFYYALNNDLAWGIRELLPGYINMLRALGLPTRLVTGFAGGNFTDVDNDGNLDTLQFSLENVQFWAEVLLVWTDSFGEKQLSWGIFNPMPILSAFVNHNVLHYGRNSLSAAANVSVEITSGTPLSNFSTSTESLNYSTTVQHFNENFQATAKLSYGDVSVPNRNLEFFLLPSSSIDIQNPQITSETLNSAVSLGIRTTNSTGHATLSGFTDLDGKLTFQDDVETTVQINETLNLTTLQNQEFSNIGGYFVIAANGIDFSYNFTGWLNDGNLNLSFSPEISIYSNYISVLTHNVNISLSAKLTDTLGRPLENKTVSLHILSESQYTSYLAKKTNSPFDTTFFEDSNILSAISQDNGNPKKTNQEGKSEWLVNFDNPDVAPVDGRVYYFIVEWDNNFVISNALTAYVTNNLSLSLLINGWPEVEAIGINEQSSIWSMTFGVLASIPLETPDGTELTIPSSVLVGGISLDVLAIDFTEYNKIRSQINSFDSFKTKVLNNETAFAPNFQLYNLSETSQNYNSTISKVFTQYKQLVTMSAVFFGNDLAARYYSIFLVSVKHRLFVGLPRSLLEQDSLSILVRTDSITASTFG